jgi:hypothetical protein
VQDADRGFGAHDPGTEPTAASTAFRSRRRGHGGGGGGRRPAAAEAILLVQNEAFVDKVTGETVPEEDIDRTTDDDPSQQPDDGLRHADTVLERTVYSPEFYCTATEAAGLQLAPFLLNQRPVVHDPIGGDSPEDREAAEAARAEAQRRERRKVISLSKLGAAAEEVRRRFVKQLLARRRAPRSSSPNAWRGHPTCPPTTRACRSSTRCSAWPATPSGRPSKTCARAATRAPR